MCFVFPVSDAPSGETDQGPGLFCLTMRCPLRRLSAGVLRPWLWHVVFSGVTRCLTSSDAHPSIARTVKRAGGSRATVQGSALPATAREACRDLRIE